jgi:hypothetical protein
MRLSDLLERPAIDQYGRSWGQIHDAHVVQDGPVLPSNLATFRLHGLVAGWAAFGTRLGYAGWPGYGPDQETKGPLPIRLLLRVLQRNAIYIPWSAVRSIEADRVVVEAPPAGFANGSGRASKDPAAPARRRREPPRDLRTRG